MVKTLICEEANASVRVSGSSKDLIRLLTQKQLDYLAGCLEWTSTEGRKRHVGVVREESKGEAQGLPWRNQ